MKRLMFLTLTLVAFSNVYDNLKIMMWLGGKHEWNQWFEYRCDRTGIDEPMVS